MSESAIIHSFAGTTDWLAHLKRYSRDALRFSHAAHSMGVWTDDTANSTVTWAQGGPLGRVPGLRCDSARGQFWFGLSDWSGLHPALVVERNDIPASVRCGLMESVTQVLIGQLQRLVGGPVSVVAVETESDRLQQELPLCAGFTWAGPAGDGSRLVQAQFRATVAMLDRAESLAALANAGSPLLAELPMHLPVLAGVSRLTITQFRSLRVGDVLRPSPPIAVDQPLRVEVPLGRQAGRRLRARVTQQSLILENLMNARIDPPPVAATDLDSVAKELPLDLDDVDLEVAIEIGQLNVTVGQLSNLKPGQALALARGINPAAVRLTVKNQMVATGELVAVGDEFAVMIKSLGGSRRGQSA